MTWSWHESRACEHNGRRRPFPLTRARRLRSGATDAALLDEALTALVAHHRAAELDAAYAAAYDAHPPDEPDDWGDLASFRDAAGATLTRLGRLSDNRMRQICSALEVAVECE